MTLKEGAKKNDTWQERSLVTAGVSVICPEGLAGRAEHFWACFLAAFPLLSQCAPS